MTVIERYQPLLGIDPAKIKQKSPQDKTRALWPQLEAREDRPLPFILPIKISWGSYPSGGMWGRHYFVNKGPSSQGYGFSSGHVWIWELDHKKKLSTEELMLLNCGVGEDSWEPLGQDPTSPS